MLLPIFILSKFIENLAQGRNPRVLEPRSHISFTPFSEARSKCFITL